MWVIALFDLPILTKDQKRAYRKFHDFLLDDGYMMLQFSVYARPCASIEVAQSHHRTLETRVPEEGEVRTLILTALQYARMRCFYGNSEKKPEKLPQQLSFF